MTNYLTDINIIWLIGIVLLILVLIIRTEYEQKYYDGLINVNEQEIIREGFTSNTKPYLWTYWELINGNTTPPDYVKLCFAIMKIKSNETFNLVILNEKNIFDYLPDLRKDINTLPIALKTDYIRVALLYRYGGFWIDADTIMMNNLRELIDKINDGYDYIGFGCTGKICKDNDGYGRPSNGVMGSPKGGILITRCLSKLNEKLDNYFKLEPKDRKQFNYFDLGKNIIWEEYDVLMKEDPNYKYYHVSSYEDGTRDIDGNWVAKEIIFNDVIKYKDIHKLKVVMLANSIYCGDDKKYNWFCKLSSRKILEGDYFISKLFRMAIYGKRV